MLVIDGNDWQAAIMGDVAGQGFEIRNDSIDVGIVDEPVQARKALRGLRHSNQILRNGPFIAHSIVDIREAEAIDLGDFEFVFQILQATIERRDVDAMSLRYKMAKNLVRAS